MEGKKCFLVGILLCILALRLFYAFQSDTFTSDGYGRIREIQQVTSHVIPSYYDSLSYSGRQVVFSPLFHYTLALFSVVFPLPLVAKIVPNVLAVFVSLFVYLIVFQLTRREGISLVTAFGVGLFPLFLKMTVNTVSPYTLALPFLLACLYMYAYARNFSQSQSLLLLFILLFPFIHSSAVFFVGGLFFYWIFCLVHRITPHEIEKELFLFSSLFITWVTFLIYKKAFLFHGINTFWQNIPAGILDSYFEPLSVISSVAAIGIIPIICGIWMVYKYTSVRGPQESYLIVGFAFFFFALLLLQLIDPNVGLLYLGVFLFILTGQAFAFALDYLDKTKLAGYKRSVALLFSILFVLSLFVFPQSAALPSQEFLTALQWVHNMTPAESVILGTVDQGHVIAALAERRNAWDTSFLLAPDAEQRAHDISLIFQTSSEVTAVKILNKYQVSYILLSPAVQAQYGISSMDYLSEKCFTKVYETETISLYNVRCGVRER